MSASTTATSVPKGTGSLLLIQFFSTITFSVLYSTLVLYISKVLHLSDAMTVSIFASFAAFNYGLHLLGGYIGGRFFSYRTLLFIGMLFQIVACLLLSMGTLNSLYWGLTCFLTGAGLNVTCLNCITTELFTPNDTRREKTFLWLYSSMNVGFFVGFSLSGYFNIGGHFERLFLISAISNVFCILILLFNWNILGDKETVLKSLSLQAKKRAHLKGFFMIVGLFFALKWLLERASFSSSLVVFAGIVMVIILSYLATRQPTSEARKKMWAYLILLFSGLSFFVLYSLAPSAITLFIDRNVDRQAGAFIVSPQWFQNINVVVIAFGAPLMAWAFQRLRQKGWRISIPAQFSAGLLLAGIGMILIPVGIHFTNPVGYSNMGWTVSCLALQAVAELLISPIGYSMIGELAPAHLQGVMMGTWMLLTGVSAAIVGLLSKFILGSTGATDPLISNHQYQHSFSVLGVITIGFGLVLVTLIPFLRKLISQTV
jgi:POT family proton-dependent oligopeptide transporter